MRDSNRCGERIRNMTPRSVRAAQLRDILRAQLGGRCSRCGQAENLQFHLLMPDGGKHHNLSARDRAYFYAVEVQRGNVQLLCASCHSRLTVAGCRLELQRRLSCMASQARASSSDS